MQFNDNNYLTEQTEAAVENLTQIIGYFHNSLKMVIMNDDDLVAELTTNYANTLFHVLLTQSINQPNE